MPKISVLMSARNVGKYIREAVDSILAQTFGDFELIIIDDASTDNTASVLDMYSDPRIIRITNDTNLRLPASLNRGIKLATGQYIARMDGDDISLPKRFEHQVDFLNNHPEVGVVSTRLELVAEDGKTPSPKYQYGHYLPTTHNMNAWCLALKTPAIAHGPCMMRREVLGQVGGYELDFPVAEDYDLWMRLIWHTRFACLPEHYYYYRQVPTSTGHTSPQEQFRSVYLIQQRFFNRLFGNQVSLEQIKHLHHSRLPMPFVDIQTLSEEHIARSIELLLNLYQKMLDQSLLVPENLDEVLKDITQRIMLINKYSVAYRENIPPAQLSRTYWKSVLPNPLVKAIRKIK